MTSAAVLSSTPASAEVPVPSIDPRELADAIARGQRVLLATQRADGGWDGASDLGPACTAQVLLALKFTGHLSAEDLAGGARWLRGQQRQDGSFDGYPFARHGDLSTTSMAWAVLELAGDPKSRVAAERAWTFVLAQGGLDAVVALANTGDVSALYLALAGKLPAERLPTPPLAWVLLPGALDLATRRMTYSVVIGALATAIIVRRLRGDWGPDGARQGLIDRLACARAIEFITTYQNERGSWNGISILTAVAIATLHAAARPADQTAVTRGAESLFALRTRSASGTHFDIFPSDIWTTAYNLRVLLESGLPRTEDTVHRAIEFLLSEQARVPQIAYDNPRRGVPRTGGWAFEAGNQIMPDSDDTAVVLACLGRALYPETGEPALSDALAARVRDAIDAGRRWLLGMQNDDGGWAGFAQGLPGKKPGPAMTATANLSFTNPIAIVKAIIHPPLIFGDPATEDLTGRVLDAFALTRDAVDASHVRRAVDFLRVQQCESGAWWGRWVVNYLAGTAYVLTGLARVGEDLGSGYVERAIDWTLARQNANGGWGERVESYVDPSLAGRGPSTAPLTGLVTTALIDVGRGDSPEVARAVAFLLRTQRSDGSWPNGDYRATALPPIAFYTYAPAANYLPLQALARYTRRATAVTKPHDPDRDTNRWTDEVLEPMRQRTDPLADELVGRVYGAGETDKLNPLLMQLFRNDDPIPAGLPQDVRDYFDRTAPLPPWADTAKIDHAQGLFERFGLQITMGLFCSSLPQAYAAANGAAVLVQTQSMQRNTKQRVFETAQFVFDVLDRGAFSPDGKGIRAAQRVRLMHAAIRLLILRRNGAQAWDVARLGKPINQEDMAGTLMTFSALTFDAMRRYGVALTDADGEAWIHAWTVVGHYMGIDESLMPTSLSDAERLMESIRRRQWAPSPEGHELMAALVEMMDEFFTFDLATFHGLMPSQVRFLAGDHCADLLGVSEGNFGAILRVGADIVRDLDVNDHEPLLAQAFGEFAHAAMAVIVTAERSGKRASFRLPSSLERAVIPGT